MQYILNVESNGLIDYMFGDSGTAYLMMCSNHPDVISFGNY